jgi:ADP-heptose:LPS heptosyltransferase
MGRRNVRNAMNILVIRLSSMGDVVLVTPLLTYLKERYPDAAVTLVTGADYAPLFADDPRLFQTIALPREAHTLPGALIAGTWDLVVDLQNSNRSRHLVSSLRSVGHAIFFDKLHWSRWALLLLRRDTYGSSPGIAARYIRAVSGASLPIPIPSPHLFFSIEARTRALALFKEHAGGIVRPSIALFPFSAWKNKEWPQYHFISVGRYYGARGWNVAIFGGPEDTARADGFKECIGSRCISLAGRLTLYECGALLSHFTLALGNDTGLSHLARAAGIKVGMLFGPTTRHFGFYPSGDPPFMVFEMPLCCRPCHAHGGNVCLRMSRRCMRSIGNKEVIAGLDALFQGG